MRFVLTILLLVLTMIPRPVQASFVDGNDLLQKCSTRERDAAYFQNQSYCMGYIVGVSDAAEFFQTAPGMPQLVCLPSNVTSGQLKDVVVKYLQDNPAKRHEDAESLILTSLAINFRCKQE